MENVRQIIEQIEAGNYEIRHEEECMCQFLWHIDGNGVLDAELVSPDCWSANSLYVGDTHLVVCDPSEYQILVKGISYNDIPDEIWHELSFQQPERWQSPNSEQHESRRRESLIEWLMECGYELDREYPRGFANEYVMILREKETDVKNSREDCEQWADAFLYRGDAATQAFVGLQFIPIER